MDAVAINQALQTISNVDIFLLHQTYKYIYDRIGRCIFVIVKNKKVTCYKIFNRNFVNTYYRELYFNDKDKKKLFNHKHSSNFANTSSELSESVDPNDRKKWYVDGIGIFTEIQDFDIDEIQTYLELEQLQDSIFFINVNNNPILRKDGKHPNNIFKYERPHVWNERSKMFPILSRYSTEEHYDLPLGIIKYNKPQGIFTDKGIISPGLPEESKPTVDIFPNINVPILSNPISTKKFAIEIRKKDVKNVENLLSYSFIFPNVIIIITDGDLPRANIKSIIITESDTLSISDIYKIKNNMFFSKKYKPTAINRKLIKFKNIYEVL